MRQMIGDLPLFGFVAFRELLSKLMGVSACVVVHVAVDSVLWQLLLEESFALATHIARHLLPHL